MARPRRVTAVVCAAFDEATDATVLAIRARARELGVTVAEIPAHRPHLTLAAAVTTDEELPRLLDVVAEYAAGQPAVPVRITEVGVFPRPGVLWLGPGPDKALADRQRDVYRLLKRSGWPPAFAETAPRRWVAHCTLATRVPRPLLRSVRESLLEEVSVVEGTISALATILVGGRGDAGYAPFAAP